MTQKQKHAVIDECVKQAKKGNVSPRGLVSLVSKVAEAYDIFVKFGFEVPKKKPRNASLKNKVEIGLCDCGCKRSMYSLGEYRLFTFTLVPFFDGWIVRAKKTALDKLDKLLIEKGGLVCFSDCLAADTVSISVKNRAHALRLVKAEVDKFWEERASIIAEILENVGHSII